MARLVPLLPAELDDAQRALYDTIVTGPRAGSGLADERGSLRGPFDPLLRAPGLGDVVQQLGARLRFRTALPDALRELAILVTAAHWECGFELAAHARIARSVGVDAAVVAALTEGRAVDLVAGSPERIVHEAASELVRTKRLSDGSYAALVALLGETQTVELVLVLGYYSLLALVLETFEVGR
jgi:4-carboxymuconolactone decarboxylase